MNYAIVFWNEPPNHNQQLFALNGQLPFPTPQVGQLIGLPFGNGRRTVQVISVAFDVYPGGVATFVTCSHPQQNGPVRSTSQDTEPMQDRPVPWPWSWTPPTSFTPATEV